MGGEGGWEGGQGLLVRPGPPYITYHFVCELLRMHPTSKMRKNDKTKVKTVQLLIQTKNICLKREGWEGGRGHLALIEYVK